VLSSTTSPGLAIARAFATAAAAAGAQPMLVLTGKGAKTEAAGGLPEGTPIFADLAEAVRNIVA